ncbi:MAG: hypothetical protein ACJA0Q_000416 [Saprospiraceae bacterium]|jgi:hypothetical protein
MMNLLKKILLFVAIFVSIQQAYTQNYIVSEEYDPDTTYGDRASQIAKLVTVQWGLNTSFLDEDSNTKLWGSNHFSAKLNTEWKIKGSVYNVLQFGWDWNTFKLKNNNDVLLGDSSFYGKRKLRADYVTVQYSIVKYKTDDYDVNGNYLQLGICGGYKVYSAYYIWDELNGVKIKNRASKLPFVNKYKLDLSITYGSDEMLIFARYRLTELFTRSDTGYTNVGSFTIGIGIHM